MAFIRFRCVRCHHSLKAKNEAVGKKMLCPVCYLELTVPAESSIKEVDPSQLYTADEKPVDVRDMQSRKEFASLPCRVCHTNIAVKKEQVGQEIECPECGTKMVVPAAIAAHIDASLNDTLDKIMLGIGPESKELYTVRDGRGSIPLDDGTDRFPVYCKLCNTLMYATDEQVGEEIVCPDCLTPTVVPPRPKDIPRVPTSSTFEGSSTFGLAQEQPPTGGPLIPVVCSLCGTRMYAAENQIGRLKTCPDCGRQTEVKPVPKEEIVQPEIGGGEYGVSVSEAPPRPTARTMTDYRYVDGSLDKEIYTAEPPEEKTLRRPPFSPGSSEQNMQAPDPGEPDRLPQRPKKATTDRVIAATIHRRPSLPEHPFIERLFAPIFHGSVMLRLLISLALALFAAVLPFLFPGLFWVVGLAFAGIVFSLWGGIHTHYCMSIFGFSTDGSDQFDEWSDFVLLDSLGSALWMFCLTLVAAAPGLFIANLLPGKAISEGVTQTGDPILQLNSLVIIRDFLFMQMSWIALFPVFFLSCMETGSFFTVLAKNTIQSLLRHTGLWIRLYLLSASLFLIPELAYAAFYAALRNVLGDVLLSVGCSVLFFGFVCLATLIYFRLLGRFGWILEETARQEEEDDD